MLRVNGNQLPKNGTIQSANIQEGLLIEVQQLQDNIQQLIEEQIQQIKRQKQQHKVLQNPMSQLLPKEQNTLTKEETNMVPATLMKKHADCTVYIDPDSASLLNSSILEKFN